MCDANEFVCVLALFVVVLLFFAAFYAAAFRT